MHPDVVLSKRKAGQAIPLEKALCGVQVGVRRPSMAVSSPHEHRRSSRYARLRRPRVAASPGGDIREAADRLAELAQNPRLWRRKEWGDGIYEESWESLHVTLRRHTIA